MRKRLLICLLLILCLPCQVFAWSYAIGDDGWWGGTHYQLDKFEFFMVTDSTFAEPPQANFSTPGWTANLINPKYSLATGPAASSLFWTFNFAGSTTQTITLDWLAYSAGVLVGDARVNFINNSFNYITLPSPNINDLLYDRASEVQIPSTFLLFATALVGLGLLGKSFRRSERSGT